MSIKFKEIYWGISIGATTMFTNNMLLSNLIVFWLDMHEIADYLSGSLCEINDFNTDDHFAVWKCQYKFQAKCMCVKNYVFKFIFNVLYAPMNCTHKFSEGQNNISLGNLFFFLRSWYIVLNRRSNAPYSIHTWLYVLSFYVPSLVRFLRRTLFLDHFIQFSSGAVVCWVWKLYVIYIKYPK